MLAMSAIGFSDIGFNEKARLIGAHADFRLNDYFFPRTQSRSLSKLGWESRIRPMHSWSELILYGMGTALSVLVLLVLFACYR
jgi:hypothetical protein